MQSQVTSSSSDGSGSGSRVAQPAGGRCILRWMMPAAIGGIAATWTIGKLRQARVVSPRAALPTYIAAYGAVGAISYWLK